MNKSGPPTRLAPSEYEAIEQAMMETARGRWFLSQFAEKSRRKDTEVVLAAIEKLESAVSTSKSQPEAERIKMDLVEMSKAIERTRYEIANLKLPEQDGGNLLDATEELDSIVSATEQATTKILQAAEDIQETAWNIREDGQHEAPCARIDNDVTDIYTACSFQDITGQRTQKVVHVLRYLEARINAMVSIWGLDRELLNSEEENTDSALDDQRPDSHLLNGPQRESSALKQNDIDGVMTTDNEAEDKGDIEDSQSEIDITANFIAQTAHEVEALSIQAVEVAEELIHAAEALSFEEEGQAEAVEVENTSDTQDAASGQEIVEIPETESVLETELASEEEATYQEEAAPLPEDQQEPELTEIPDLPEDNIIAEENVIQGADIQEADISLELADIPDEDPLILESEQEEHSQEMTPLAGELAGDQPEETEEVSEATSDQNIDPIDNIEEAIAEAELEPAEESEVAAPASSENTSKEDNLDSVPDILSELESEILAAESIEEAAEAQGEERNDPIAEQIADAESADKPDDIDKIEIDNGLDDVVAVETQPIAPIDPHFSEEPNNEVEILTQEQASFVQHFSRVQKELQQASEVKDNNKIELQPVERPPLPITEDASHKLPEPLLSTSESPPTAPEPKQAVKEDQNKEASPPNTDQSETEEEGNYESSGWVGMNLALLDDEEEGENSEKDDNMASSLRELSPKDKTAVFE